MAGWTLADIIAKVRLTTGRPDDSQLTTADITSRINQYYQYVLPKELKIFFGYTYYTFYTVANTPTYFPPSTAGIPDFQTFNPQVTADGFPIDWYLSPDLFYQDYPIQENKVPVGTGDGSTGPFSFNIPNFPILPGTLYVTDGTAANTVQDAGIVSPSGTGTFTLSDGTTVVPGTIDYAAGTITGLEFPNVTAIGANIIASCQQFFPNRPQGILYYNDRFELRSVPDQVYKITMQGIKVPTAFVNPTDRPFREDLGPLIAFGTALEIFSDYDQLDQYDQYLSQYLRYKDISMQDTYEEYLYQRSVPKF